MKENGLKSEFKFFSYIISLSTLSAFIVAYLYSINLGYDPMAMGFFLAFLYFVIVLSLYSGKDKIIHELTAAKQNSAAEQSSATKQSSGNIPSGLVDDLQKNLTKYENLVRKLKDEKIKLKSAV